MTLSVSVHQWEEGTGKLGPDLVVGPAAALAGFELWRTTVYGSAAIRKRGALLLPRLATGDLLIEGSELLAFQQECELLLKDVAAIAAELGLDSETLRFRLSNIANAIAQAIAIGGVVWVS